MTIYAVGSGAGGHNWKFRRGQRKEVTGSSLELVGESFVEPLDIPEVYDRGIVTDGSFGASVEVGGTQGSQQVRPTIYNVMTLSEAMKDTPYANPMVYSTISLVPIEGVLILGGLEISKRGVVGAGSLDNYKEILERLRNRGHRLAERIERFSDCD